MVSIETLRDDALRSKYEERSTFTASRKRKLRELYAVVRHVEFQRKFPEQPAVPAGQPVPPYLSWEPSSEDDYERQFLEGNDISRKLYYDERTLPAPKPRPPEPPAIITNGASPNLRTSPTGPISAPSPTSQLPLTPAPSAEEFGVHPKRLSIDAGVQKVEKPQQPPSPVDEPSTSPSLESIQKRDSEKDNWNSSADTTSETTTITPPHERQTVSPPSLSPSSSFHKSPDRSAPIANIGGIPVIQSIHPEPSAKSGPDAAVHPPPVPASVEFAHEDEAPKESGASSLPSPQESSAVMEEDLPEEKEDVVIEKSVKIQKPVKKPALDVEAEFEEFMNRNAEPRNRKSVSQRMDAMVAAKDAAKATEMPTLPVKEPVVGAPSPSPLAEADPDVREDPNAQLRMELEMAKKEPEPSREDVEMKEAPKAVEVPEVVDTVEVEKPVESEPQQTATSPEVTEKSIEDEAVVSQGFKPTAISDEVEMRDAVPAEAPKPVEPTPSSKDAETPEPEAELTKVDHALAESSESDKNIQAAIAPQEKPAGDAVKVEKIVAVENVDVTGADKQKRLSGSLAEQESLAFTRADERLSDKRPERQRKKPTSFKDEPYLIRQKFALRQPKDLAEDEALKEANQSISIYKRQQHQPEETSLLKLLHTIDSSASLTKALQASHKTLNTQNHALAYHELVAQRVLTRVLQLEDSGKWGLRQPPRVPEPKRKETHWDFLLREARWLREDFHEEHKWKIATARTVALWCQDWNEALPKERKSMQVRARIPEPRVIETVEESLTATQVSPKAANEPAEKPVKSEEDVDMDMAVDELPSMFDTEPEPSSSHLASQHTVTGSQSLLLSLIDDGIPIYKPPTLPAEDILEEGVEESWQLPIAPVSKYLTAKVDIVEKKYTRKRSRFDYDPNPEQYAQDSDDEGHDSDRPRKRVQTSRPSVTAPLQSDCALFNPSSKGILNRAAQATALKPPTGSHIPAASFFSSRQPSQWTAQDDETLKEAIQQYPQNWPLISTTLIPKGEFHSSVERRSPWECFERHVSMLDSLPPEFSKSPYFRGIQQRLEWAQKGGETYVNPAGGQGSGQNTPTIKRKGTMPIRVEKKRNTRALNMVEAMRRLAKKREASVSKQHNAAAVRKPETNTGPKNVTQTPEHFSKMKHEWELKQQMKLQHQQQALAQQQQRNANMMRAGQIPQTAVNAQIAQQVAAQHGAGANLVIPSSHAQGLGMQHAMQRTPSAMAHMPQVMGQKVPVQAMAQQNHLAVPRPNGQNYTQEQINRIMMDQQRMKAIALQQQQQHGAMQAAQAQREAGQHSSPVPMSAGLPMNFQANGTNVLSQAHLLQAQQQQQAAVNASSAANNQKPHDIHTHTPSGVPRPTIDAQLPHQQPLNPGWSTQANQHAPNQHQLQIPQSLAAQNVNSAQQMQEYHKRLRELMGPGTMPPQHAAAAAAAAAANSTVGMQQQQQQQGNVSMHSMPQNLNQHQMYQLQVMRQQSQLQQAQRAAAQQAALATAAGGGQMPRSPVPGMVRPGSQGGVSQQSPRLGQVQQVGQQGQGQ